MRTPPLLSSPLQQTLVQWMPSNIPIPSSVLHQLSVRSGDTVLHIASANGMDNVIRMLLATASCDINARNTRHD